jgi:hypothetical protein
VDSGALISFRRTLEGAVKCAFLHFLRLLVTALENFMVPLCSKPLAQSADQAIMPGLAGMIA